MSFKVERSPQMILDIYGKQFPVTKLTAGAREKLVNQYEEKTEQNPKEAARFAMDFVASMGVPREELEAMESDHFDSLFQFLVNSNSVKKS